MEQYFKVDVNEYVKRGLESGFLVPRQAEKFARIIARPGQLGEQVISWSEDEYGVEILEKDDIVKEDSITKLPGWIATKVNERGEIIIDRNGHANQWIIDDSIFHDKYEIDPENIGLFKAKGLTQTFVQIPHNITLNQWGQEMKISAGGFINITNLDDMYGISQRDFLDTYQFTDENKKHNKL